MPVVPSTRNDTPPPTRMQPNTKANLRHQEPGSTTGTGHRNRKADRPDLALGTQTGIPLLWGLHRWTLRCQKVASGIPTTYVDAMVVAPEDIYGPHEYYSQEQLNGLFNCNHYLL